ncbi:MAG: efflux RND transporter periplasmic adaptor subunit [Thermoanaerobaculia bacterium]
MPTLRGWFAAAIGLALLGCSSHEDLDLAGTVERKTLELAAPISEVVVDIPVRIGERVQEGQVVVRLDDSVASAELAAAKAAHAAAQASRIEVDQEFSRIEGLHGARVATRQELDRARRAKDEATALVAERDARVAQARKRWEALTVRSWGDGTIDQLPFEVGERTSAGSVVAVVLADDEPYVRVWIPARAASRLTPGATASIRVEGLDEPLHGELELINREPTYTPHYALTERESAHLVYESRVRILDAPEGLRPGLPARVTLEPGAGSEP